MAASTTTRPVKPMLPVKDPVPSDIDIAQSIKPLPIVVIAEDRLGLQPDEYELYGTTKAKVCISPHVRSPRCAQNATMEASGSP